jgi:D-lactate dehydrogenase
VRESNFSLDGLVGFDLYEKTVGIVGTGRIGSVLARIMNGFGCHVLAHDRIRNPTLENIGVQYADFDELLQRADIMTLHVPLTPETRHLIGAKALSLTKRGVMLISTGRSTLVDTRALIHSLKTGHIGYAWLDVYEEEEGIFFEDLSDKILQEIKLRASSRFQTFS